MQLTTHVTSPSCMENSIPCNSHRGRLHRLRALPNSSITPSRHPQTYRAVSAVTSPTGAAAEASLRAITVSAALWSAARHFDPPTERHRRLTRTAPKTAPPCDAAKLRARSQVNQTLRWTALSQPAAAPARYDAFLPPL